MKQFFNIAVAIVGLALWAAAGNAAEQAYLEQFPMRQQTKKFDFRFISESLRTEEIVRFSDAFIAVLNRDFFKVDFDFPIRVLVLEDQDEFKKFAEQQLKVKDPPGFGMYFYATKMFVTYETSGLGTYAHEIMHPLVDRNLPNAPAWSIEGIPAFFEKFYGYWQGDDLVLYWGYQNPWRIAQLGTNLTQLNLRKILYDPNPDMSHSSVERNESNLRMVSMFLWEQGRFKRFLRLIQTKDRSGYPSYFEAAMELPLEKIIPLWQDYLTRVAGRRDALLKLPPSTILSSKAEFEVFAKHHRISAEPVNQQN